MQNETDRWKMFELKEKTVHRVIAIFEVRNTEFRRANVLSKYLCVVLPFLYLFLYFEEFLELGATKKDM